MLLQLVVVLGYLLRDNSLGSGSSQSLNPSSNTTYTVTVTDASNGCTDTESINITVNNAAPSATITNNTGSNEITCNQASISVTASGAGSGGSYSWSNSLGSSANQTLNPSTNTTYTVTVTDASSGCTDTESIAYCCKQFRTCCRCRTFTAVCDQANGQLSGTVLGTSSSSFDMICGAQAATYCNNNARGYYFTSPYDISNY